LRDLTYKFARGIAQWHSTKSRSILEVPIHNDEKRPLFLPAWFYVPLCISPAKFLYRISRSCDSRLVCVHMYSQLYDISGIAYVELYVHSRKKSSKLRRVGHVTPFVLCL
jgi:hypothetical protein